MEAKITSHRDDNNEIVLIYPESISLTMDDFIITKRPITAGLSHTRQSIQIGQTFCMALRPNVLKEIYDLGGLKFVNIIFLATNNSYQFKELVESGEFGKACDFLITMTEAPRLYVPFRRNTNSDTLQSRCQETFEALKRKVDERIHELLAGFNAVNRYLPDFQHDYFRAIERTFTSDHALDIFREKIDPSLEQAEAELAQLEERVEQARKVVRNKQNQALLQYIGETPSLNGTTIPARVVDDLCEKASNDDYFPRPLFG